jgi:hypothetical protein
MGSMKNKIRVAAVVAASAAGLILIPAGIASASGNGDAPRRSGDPVGTCTYDQQQDRLHLRDGTGVRHDTQVSTGGKGHRSGPQDGSGPRADRPMDGTGHKWGGAGHRSGGRG